ncbi:MAG: DNA-binding protein WhiA [Dethiosulfovibrio sp.]|nr:DNA-binding protein WhiA [Dethiosulfovibrio sp.]
MEPLVDSLWDEWVATSILDVISAESELAGIVSCLKKTSCPGGDIRLSSRRLWVFRRIRKLWGKTRWSSGVDMGDILKVPKRHKGSVSIRLPVNVLSSIEAKEHDGSFIRWSWIRGVFGVTGALYQPKRGYYFLFRVSNREVVSGLVDHLAKNHISPSSRDVSDTVELIVRDQAQIVDLVNGMGLPNTALRLEEMAIIRSMRDRANRLVNCDASNIKKSVDAARRQIHVARFPLDKGCEKNLSPELLELIELRLTNPSISLNELGSNLSIPVTKSTVTYRWKKLIAIAESNGFMPDI